MAGWNMVRTLITMKGVNTSIIHKQFTCNRFYECKVFDTLLSNSSDSLITVSSAVKVPGNVKLLHIIVLILAPH